MTIYLWTGSEYLEGSVDEVLRVASDGMAVYIAWEYSSFGYREAAKNGIPLERRTTLKTVRMGSPPTIELVERAINYMCAEMNDMREPFILIAEGQLM